VGTSEPEMARLTTRITDDVRHIPGVANVGAHVGRAVLGDQVVDVNSGELWVSIDPDADYGATVSRVKDALASYPGVAQSVAGHPQHRVHQRHSTPDDH